MSQYLPVSLQWGHWYWRFGHVSLRWWSRSQRKIFTSFLFSVHLFGQCRRVYSHALRWSESLQRGTKALQWVLGQGIFTFGHVSRWVVVISQYLPMVSQWRHWYWRLGHSFLRCWSRSRRNILTSFLSSMHWLVQWTKVYPHVVRWSSRDRNSPIQPHQFSKLLHMTLSDLISCSPTTNSAGNYAACYSRKNWCRNKFSEKLCPFL